MRKVGYRMANTLNKIADSFDWCEYGKWLHETRIGWMIVAAVLILGILG